MFEFYNVYPIQMYPIYVDGCGEMKMRMLNISNIYFFGSVCVCVGWGGRGGEAAKCAAYVKMILFYK